MHSFVLSTISEGAKSSRARSRRAAFTLMEILVVLAIIMLLAAMLFPVFSRSRESARRATCQSNLKQIGLSVLQYAEDYDSKTPPRYTGTGAADRNPNNWRVLIYPYVKSIEIFRCPSNPENETSATDAPADGIDISASYAVNYNSGTGLGVFGNNDGRDIVHDAMVTFPSETISVAETTSTRPDIDMDDIALFGELYAGHIGVSNYLFFDGHVKALKPLQTYYTGSGIKNMWHRDHSEFAREE